MPHIFALLTAGCPGASASGAGAYTSLVALSAINCLRAAAGIAATAYFTLAAVDNLVGTPCSIAASTVDFQHFHFRKKELLLLRREFFDFFFYVT